MLRLLTKGSISTFPNKIIDNTSLMLPTSVGTGHHDPWDLGSCEEEEGIDRHSCLVGLPLILTALTHDTSIVLGWSPWLAHCSLSKEQLSFCRFGTFYYIFAQFSYPQFTHPNLIQPFLKSEKKIKQKTSTFRQRQTYSWYGENEDGVVWQFPLIIKGAWVTGCDVANSIPVKGGGRTSILSSLSDCKF